MRTIVKDVNTREKFEFDVSSGEMRMVMDKRGYETPDPTPMAPPIGYKKQPSMVEIVRDMVRQEKMRQSALEQLHETIEEADDFNIEDDPPEPGSRWENDRDPSIAELLRAGREALAAKEANARKSSGSVEEPEAPSGDEPAGAPPVAPKPAGGQ